MDPKNNNQNAQAAAGPQVNLGNISVGMSDDEEQDYITAWQNSVSSTPNTGWSSASGNNPLVVSAGSFVSLDEFRDSDDIEDRFIEVTSHLSEEEVSAMLDKVKAFSERSYLKSLANLISYPNYRQISEKMITERFTDINRAIGMFNSKFRFAMVYGKILDSMPGLKLLLEMNKDKK
jgi:hypothetical protein